MVTSFEIKALSNVTDYILVREAISDALVITAKLSKGNIEVATSNQSHLCGVRLSHHPSSGINELSERLEGRRLAELETVQISFAAVSNVYDGERRYLSPIY